MPAYIFAIRRNPVRDEDAMAEYQKRTRQLTGEYTMVPRVIYGQIQALEGTAPDGVIMLEFPSVEEAQAWYNDEGYQAAVPFRQKAADYDVYIVEGLNR